MAARQPASISTSWCGASSNPVSRGSANDLNWLMRRNRSRTVEAEKRRAVRSSSSLAQVRQARDPRRAHLAVLAGFLLPSTPVRTISMTAASSAFTGQIERRWRPMRMRLSLRRSRRHRERGGEPAMGRSRASAEALAEQPARHGRGANRRGALGRLGPAQHPRPAVREIRYARACGAAALSGRRHRVAGRTALSIGAGTGARGGHAHRGAAPRRARRWRWTSIAA